MRTIPVRATLVFLSFLSTLNVLLAQASGGGGAEGESPYSSSTVESSPNEDFLSSYGLVIGCLVIFVGLIVFISLRGRTRT